MKLFRPYLSFIIIGSLFVVAMVMCAVIYRQYGKNLDTEKQKQISLEITLPVIEWNKYEGLSKKYEDGRVK